MMDTRFEVGDPNCGVIACAATWFRAYVIAKAHNQCPEVSIFDRMAHPGRSDIWVNGLTTHIRPQAQ